TEDKDKKAIDGAKETLRILAAQEVQLRTNIERARVYAELVAMGISETFAAAAADADADMKSIQYAAEVAERMNRAIANINKTGQEGAGKKGGGGRSESEAARMLKQIQESTVALKGEAAAYGKLTEAEKELAIFEQQLLVTRDKSLKANAAKIRSELEAKRVAELANTEAKREIDLRKEHLAGMHGRNEAAYEQKLALEEEIALFGLSESAGIRLTMAIAEENLERLKRAQIKAAESADGAKNLAMYDEEIKKAQQLVDTLKGNV